MKELRQFISEQISFISSSVGRKVLMAITGLFLMSFLIVHLLLNLTLFAGEQSGTFNTYAEFMSTYPLLRPMEILLFAGFCFHGFLGIWLYIKNRRSRPIGYVVDKTSKTVTASSRLTMLSGVVVATFLVVHINAFFIHSRFLPSGKTMYQLVATTFSNKWVVLFYIASLITLGYHLKHGFQSAFQTLGLRFPKYIGLINIVSIFFWLVIPATFASIPIILYFTQR